MSHIISNTSRSLKFFDRDSGCLLSRAEALGLDAWDARLRNVDLDAHLRNGAPPYPRPDQYESVVGLFPIPARTRWIWKDGRFSFHSPIQAPSPNLPAQPSLADLDRIAKRYLRHFRNRTVAVELSGGLDTAIIIELVRAAGGRPVLVGFFSDRYEFRTERAVQNLYLSGPEKVVTIPQTEVPPFADLESTPPHVLPAVPSLFHRLHSVIADAARSSGATCVLNGVGGDALLCDDFSGRHFPVDYHGWGLHDPWPNDNVYSTRGMSYIPAFALWPIPELIWLMRKGRAEDPQKLWARRLFDGRLPTQLTRWSYKGDHVGHFHSGLQAAEEGARVVAQTAYQRTRSPALEPDTISAMIRRSMHLGDSDERRLLSLLSFATWVHALVREGIA